MTASREIVPKSAATPPFYVGVDLGGTNVKVGVVDDLGQTLAWMSIPTEPGKGPEDATARMGAAVKESMVRSGLTPAEVAWVGLGSPGTMDIPAGRLISPVNLGKAWNNFPIRQRLADHCGLNVAFANDAGAAAYGEFWVGSGRAFHSMVMLTLGTGIGCGIIIGDLSIDGEHSHGAECGHIIINDADDARLCGCGKRGHLEAYASATAVIARTHEALEAGRESSVSQRLAEGKKLTPKLLAEEAEAGDRLSWEIIEQTARYLGVGITSLMHTIDPAGVLLGGAMTFGGRESELGCRFLSAVKNEVDRRAFPLLAERITLDFAALGADAGYIGAAGVARLEYRKQAGH
jgi:glucokinase